MDEPPFALVRLALPASIVAKGGSFFTVSTLVLFSSTSIACGFLVNKKARALPKQGSALAHFVLLRKRENYSCASLKALKAL